MGAGVKSLKNKNWIQDAVKQPGAFTAWCKAKGFGGVTQACIAAGKNSDNPTIKRRANLAATFKKMAKKRKAK